MVPSLWISTFTAASVCLLSQASGAASAGADCPAAAPAARGSLQEGGRQRALSTTCAPFRRTLIGPQMHVQGPAA